MKVEIGQATLYLGDCLEVMPSLPSVEAVVTDPPYGITACGWDVAPNLQTLWAAMRRVAAGRIILTATQPFASDVIASNRSEFKHAWVWDKVRPVGFQVAKHRPLMQHEDVLVFMDGKYRPQMRPRHDLKRARAVSRSESSPLAHNDGAMREYVERYPSSIITFSNASQVGKDHPTQKPVELMSYLIRTYTDEGDLVLDPFMGSGTTGVACMAINRRFIGVEAHEPYFNIACERIDNAQRQTSLIA